MKKDINQGYVQETNNVSVTLDKNGYLESGRNELKENFEISLKEIKKRSEKLTGKRKKNLILKFLKENYVEIEENVEYLGYKGRIIHVNIPQAGGFSGFNFDFFVSDVRVFKRDFGSNEKLCKKSYLVKNIIELLKATNAYLKAMGIEADGDMDYENGLRYWENGNNGCKAGEFLKNLAGLDVRCWLKDIKVEGDEEFVSMWFLVGECCYFCWGSRPFLDGNLFLRLSD